MFDRIAETFARHIDLRRVVGLYRRQLSQTIFRQSQGVIQHGPFAGMALLDRPSWGRSDQGVMILGMYEQEVLNELMNAPAHFRKFVDVGAADGYYPVGLLRNGRIDGAIAFESDAENRAAIARLAEKNHVQQKITVLEAAADDFVQKLQAHNVQSQETMFLIDIEGAEFKVLTESVFAFLQDSMIIVETHAHIYPDPQAEIDGLIKRASGTHRATISSPGARNPWVFQELEKFSEADRWLICSEGRFELQHWLRFDPIEKAV